MPRLFLFLFGEGNTLTRLREELLLHVGWIMYGLPPFLVTLSFLFFKIKSTIGKPNVPVGIGIILVSLMSLTQQGIVGEGLWNVIASRVSTEGALMSYLAMIIVGVIVLFNSSLDAMVNFILMGGSALGDMMGSALRKLLAKKDKDLFYPKKYNSKIKVPMRKSQHSSKLPWCRRRFPPNFRCCRSKDLVLLYDMKMGVSSCIASI